MNGQRIFYAKFSSVPELKFPSNINSYSGVCFVPPRQSFVILQFLTLQNFKFHANCSADQCIYTDSFKPQIDTFKLKYLGS